MISISRSWFVTVLVFFICLTFLTYYYRYPAGDDGWFAEQSYLLLEEGVIRSEFFRGLLGWENQILVSHKLFLMFGSVLIHLFGCHLPVLKLSGLIFFLIMASELVYYVSNRERKFEFNSIAAVLILIFANRLLVKMSFENRPEMMLAALGFGSFLLLNSSKSHVSKVALAGILAGIAVLCHLNGAIYLAGGCLTLLIFRRYKDLIIFGFLGGITAAFYLTDILMSQNGFDVWLHQFRNDPATQNSFSFGSKALQVITFPRMFFHSPEQLALSLLLVFLIWSQRRLLTRLPIFLRTYAIVIVSIFWLITKANFAIYMVLFMPFMIALVYELYILRPFVNMGFRFVVATYFVIGIFGMGQIIYKNLSQEYAPEAYWRLSENIPKGEVGFVPLTFFFDEYPKYKRLLAHENYKIAFKKEGTSTTSMADWAYQNKVGFMLFDYDFRPEPFHPKAGIKKIPHFRLVYFDGRFAIYRAAKGK